jgi:hypothetical protein
MKFVMVLHTGFYPCISLFTCFFGMLTGKQDFYTFAYPTLVCNSKLNCYDDSN